MSDAFNLFTMELFKSEHLKSKAFRNAIIQKGGSIEIDRYIYGMQGEGLGNLLGPLVKQAIPLNGATIKAAVSKPKVTSASTQKKVIISGSKRAAGKLEIPQSQIHRPHKKKRRAGKWQGL